MKRAYLWSLNMISTFFVSFICVTERFPFFMIMGQPSCTCSRGYWQPSGKTFKGVGEYWQPYDKVFTRDQMVTVTFWKIPQWSHICQRGLLILSDTLPGVLITPWSIWQKVLDSIQRHLMEGGAVILARGNHFAIPLKNLNTIIHINQEATYKLSRILRVVYFWS